MDDLARGYVHRDVVGELRRTEHSRRKLLLRALDDSLTKAPHILDPLPPPDDAWELLGRAQAAAPKVLDHLLAHPYTGSWLGYVTRLVRNQITGVCPLWVHAGHLHALAAAAAIRAGINFDTAIPVWDGGAMLPTLGMARLATSERWSVAQVRATGDRVEISNGTTQFQISRESAVDTPNWWGLRQLTTRAEGPGPSVWLDDLDPYRGLYEPVLPQRISSADVDHWRSMLDKAWQLITRCLPDLAAGLPPGLDSLVPRPAIPFQNLSASTGEAFGSAIIALPADPVALAATLVHEFHHMLLSGLLHLIPMHDADTRARFYTLWRDDPRPISGVLQGVYAFFGVTAFWRSVAELDESDGGGRRAQFEFAYWRTGTWRTLQALSGDASLSQAGQRFVDGIADRLGPWQEDPVPADIADLAAAAVADHAAGWRLRHVRPSPATVTGFGESWLAETTWPDVTISDQSTVPTPVPDGSWSSARTALIRETLTAEGSRRLREIWRDVPGATPADLAYVTGRIDDAIPGYLTELAGADTPASWVGLGLALAAHGGDSAGARALLDYPEVVRGVYRWIRSTTGTAPDPDELAVWIGRSAC